MTNHKLMLLTWVMLLALALPAFSADQTGPLNQKLTEQIWAGVVAATNEEPLSPRLVLDTVELALVIYQHSGEPADLKLAEEKLAGFTDAEKLKALDPTSQANLLEAFLLAYGATSNQLYRDSVETLARALFTAKIEKTLPEFHLAMGRKVESFLHGAVVLDNPRLSKHADSLLQILDRGCLDSEGRATGLNQKYSPDPGYLVAQVAVARVMLADYHHTGNGSKLHRAVMIMDWAHQNLSDPSGGFLLEQNQAIDFSQLSELDNSAAIIQANLEATRVYLELYFLTNQEFYREVVEKNLELIKASVLAAPELYPAYGTVLNRLFNYPIKLIIVGPRDHPETVAMLSAARQIYEPRKLVQAVDPKLDPDILAWVLYPEMEVPTTFVCGEMCLTPITKASEIPATVETYRVKILQDKLP